MRHTTRWFVGGIVLTIIAWFALHSRGLDMAATVRRTDFPDGFAWLNTDRPLRLSQELKGHVVLLDFWTYCCINCMHVLPDLAYLEKHFAGQPFIVVGVHSNKFSNEGQVPNVRSAIQRYGIAHPVIVDEKMRLWNEYAINSWPTLVLVGADGRIVGQASGEGNREVLERSIDRALAVAKAAGTLAKEPVKFQREGMVVSTSGLAFPGRVVADAAAHRLLIVDSNHNRLVLTSWPDDLGRCDLIRIIGSGKPGRADGEPAAAEFNRPQGAALTGDTAYVADTENHLIRQVDLKTGRVTTILGTGQQAWERDGGQAGLKQGLNSPWDLALTGNTLYLAMAGDHQIWAMDLTTAVAAPVAGSGRENIRDGPARSADLAQTSGLALDTARQRLYFADSEVSAVRYLDLKDQTVHTIIGEGLFVFGDVDGAPPKARFQHPLGVGLFGDNLLVADTYNHKIRLVEPDQRTAQTWLGTGKPGTGDPGAGLALYEPAGVTAAAGKVFIADTNNHRVLVVDSDRKAWRELMIGGLIASDAPSHPTQPAGTATATVTPGRPVRFSLSPKLPAGTHLTPGAPISIAIQSGGKTLWQQTIESATPPLKITAPANVLPAADWTIDIAYAYCTEGKGEVCTPAAQSWKVTVKPGTADPPEVLLGQ